MEPLSDSDFPCPEQIINNRRSHNTFFENELIYLFFIASPQCDLHTLKSLSTRVINTLHVFQQLDDDPLTGQWKQVFRLYYAFVMYSRDFFIGKGLQTFSYMLIYSWHQVFPDMAMNALEYFLYQYDTPSFGSWRDIKYLCEMVKRISPMRDNDPLIANCISIMNRQLNDDIHTWIYSSNSRSPEHISMVSKWIPRENKRFHWLYNLLVEDWVKTTHPNIIKTAIRPEIYFKAMSKAKRMYRKKFSMLNKAIETMEINLCKHNYYDIQPYSIPRTSFHKIRQIQNKLHTDDYSNKTQLHIQKCLDRYDSFYQEAVESRSNIHTWFSVPTPGFYVKEALHIINSPRIDLKYRKKICDEWSKHVLLMNTSEHLNILPVVDISISMQQNNKSKLYDAIGMALIACHNSSFGKRILTIDSKPVWIQLDDCGDFVSTIQYIFDLLQYHCSPHTHFFNSVSFLTASMSMSSSLVHDMKMVFFSDFQQPADFFEKFPAHIESSFRHIQCRIPKVVFWNVGNQNLIDIHNDELDNHFVFSSGNTFHSMESLQQCFQDNHSSIHMIEYLLRHPRYYI